jgi:geranylgeranyl diphosphate synthase type II
LFSNQEEAEELKRLFAIQPEDSTDKIERVKALLIVLGLQKQRKMRFRILRAFQMLDQMNISDDKKKLLKAFGENLMGRKV